ncbi:Dc12 family protein, partial [Globisporangium splendens]
MCGRARCTLSREQAAQEAGVAQEEFINGDKYNPVENMGPGRYVPIVYQGHTAGDSEKNAKHSATPAKHLEAMRWGLIPSFTKPDAKPDHFIMFNARSDTVKERPAFKRLVERKRCVVICDGLMLTSVKLWISYDARYYEWQQVDKKEKQPYYFQRRSGVMKVILTEEGLTRWLSDAKFDKVKDLLVPCPVSDLQWYPVDKRVGSTKFQSEECAKKVDIKHAGNIKSFFGAKTEKREPTDADANAQEYVKQESPANANAEASIKPEERPTQQGTPQTTTPKKKDSAAFFSSPVRNYERRSEADKSPFKSSSSAEGFVKASSLLAKRHADGDDHSPQKSFSSPSKRTSPNKKPKTAHARDPKQGTLHAFFQPKH